MRTVTAPELLRGQIRSVRGPVVDVYFPQKLGVPPIFNALRVLSSEDTRQTITLEVMQHLGGGVVRALAMEPTDGLKRDMRVVDSGQQIRVPVGRATAGRLMNVLGEPIDELGPLLTEQRRSIHRPAPPFDRQLAPNEIIETGIKAIDLLCPFVRGGKNCLMGGAGVGKTLLLTELMRNISERYDMFGVFVGIGERIREGYEVWEDLRASGVIDRTSLVFGCMSESAGARFRAGLAALTVAEYFQEDSKDVLLYVDNIARFALAGSEVSSLMGRLPGQIGYSPTLDIDIGEFQERIAMTSEGSITSIQTAYLPADDYTDPIVVATLNHADVVVELSRSLCEMGIFPSVDPLKTSSVLMDPAVVGEKHFNVARKVQQIIQRYHELQDILAVLGRDELSEEDQVVLTRARRIYQFMSQPFSAATELTGIPGKLVPLEKTVRGFDEILQGNCDDFPEQAFYMIGDIEDLSA